MALYTLDLAQPKRNVFVTQLRDSEDEEDSKVKKYPIVEERVGRLMSSGIRTLQSTRLLDQHTKAMNIEKEFDSKKKELRKKIAACKTEEQKLEKKQQGIKEKVNKFDKFIKETEAKRRRALERYQIEHNMAEQKSKELEIQKEELKKLTERHKHLKKKVEKYSIYKNYLLKVIDIIPEDYLDNCYDSMMVAIMMRYQTLTTTNNLLQDSLTTLTDKIKFYQEIIRDSQQKYNQQIMVHSSELGALQNKLESYTQGNAQQEHLLYNKKETYRNQSSILGKTKLAVTNIAETCMRKHAMPLLNQMTLDQMLTLIQEFMVEHNDICKMAELLESQKLVNSLSREKPDKQLVDSQEFSI